MQIRIISVGKTNIPYAKKGVAEFTNRLRHYVKFSWEELPDIKISNKGDRVRLVRLEGESILKQLNVRDQVYLLDDKGKMFDSEELANWLNDFILYPKGDLVFIIGGAYGFSDEVVQRANGKISLSKMTFNHQMVRMILAEQIYRAFTIIKGEPYHHA